MIDVKATHAAIRAAARESALTTKDIMDELYVTRSTVAKWMYGGNLPSLDNFCALADLFGCKLDDLIIRDCPAERRSTDD